MIHKTRKKGTKVKRLLLLTDIYEKYVFSVSKTGASVEKIQVLPTGFESMTF